MASMRARQLWRAWGNCLCWLVIAMNTYAHLQFQKISICFVHSFDAEYSHNCGHNTSIISNHQFSINCTKFLLLPLKIQRVIRICNVIGYFTSFLFLSIWRNLFNSNRIVYHWKQWFIYQFHLPVCLIPFAFSS